MVLMFNDGTNPNNIMHGQTWTKLPGGYALTTTNNTNGGDNSITDAQNHKPGSSYQGGLPNIVRQLQARAVHQKSLRALHLMQRRQATAMVRIKVLKYLSLQTTTLS